MVDHTPVGDRLIAALIARQRDLASSRAFLENRLGLPPNLLDDLKNDDDWTFVIRLHALVESMLNHAITEKLGFPELSNAISFLSTSDARTGKVEIALRLGILDRSEASPVKALSQVRNWMVHDVRNVGRTLKDCLADESDSGQQRRKSLIKAFTPKLTSPSLGLAESLFLDNPLLVIHTTFLSWAARLEIHLQSHTLQREHMELLQDYANHMLAALDARKPKP